MIAKQQKREIKNMSVLYMIELIDMFINMYTIIHECVQLQIDLEGSTGHLKVHVHCTIHVKVVKKSDLTLKIH